MLQVGAPASREIYIQRLGRTGRAGRSGRGLLLLCTYEKNFISQLKGLTVRQDAPTFDASAEALKPLAEAAVAVPDELAAQT